MLYLITKLQNLKAIHNDGGATMLPSLLYLITKLQNLKAIHNMTFDDNFIPKLYLITKLQNLKAIHNDAQGRRRHRAVVSNYKITKSESYSQRSPLPGRPKCRCI